MTEPVNVAGVFVPTPVDKLIQDAQTILRTAVSKLLNPESTDRLDFGQVKRLIKIIESLNQSTPRVKDFPGMLSSNPYPYRVEAREDADDGFEFDNEFHPNPLLAPAYVGAGGTENRMMEMAGGLAEKMAGIQNPPWKEAEALTQILSSETVSEDVKIKVRKRLSKLFEDQEDDPLHSKQLRGLDVGAGPGGEGMLSPHAPALDSGRSGAQEGADQVPPGTGGATGGPEVHPAGHDGQGAEVPD